MPDQHQILLQTKLHRPRPTRYLVQRQRLLEKLDEGKVHPLILVCAPAGYGKSTLVSSWIESMGNQRGSLSVPAAWLSLDQRDSEVESFLEYLIGAVRTIFEGACPKTLDLILSKRQPALRVITTSLMNEIAQLPRSFVLVLDDYQTIQGETVHDLLDELLQHPLSPLHLVLISRNDPPVSLARLRANGMLTEIRSRDLRFEKGEATAYLGSVLDMTIGDSVLTQLEELLEGWIAGLRLAALSLRTAGDASSALTTLARTDTNMADYLADEVLAHQLPAIHAFLLKTSILDRFCAPLCEAIIGETDTAWDVRACLDWIERSELFITSLDDRREWYRYHHLFQELLQQRLAAELGPDQVKDLHRRASVWLEERGLLDEALHHALAAGDLRLAAQQMNAGLREVLNREDRPTLERWLSLLPDEMKQSSPGLLMIRVWALQFTWRLDLQAKVIQQVEALLDSGAGAALPVDELKILRGQVLTLRAQQAYFSNQPAQAIDLCRQALALLPPAWTFVRGRAMLFLGMSMQASGQGPEAERLLLGTYESYGEKTDVYALFLLRSLGFNYLKGGQLEQSRQIAWVLLQGATQSRIAIMRNWGDYFPAVVQYERNELEDAVEHFSRIIENRYTAQITAYRDAVAGLALIHQKKGEGAEALQIVESMSQFDLEQTGSEDDRTRSLRARLMVMQGDLEGAGRWADAFTDLPPDQSLFWLEEPQVTRARVLVARGTDADLRLALELLDVLDEIAERTHNTRHRIEILALRALALEAQGKSGRADAVLNQATALARLGGFIRVFVDLGPPLQGILKRLDSRSPTGDYVHRLLAAFPDERRKRGNGKTLMPAATGPAQYAPVPAEPLTARERDVLKLLREPLGINEIAEKLNLSPSTVKRHIANIYGKLEVNRRWDAVAKAEELSIIPPR